jgi:transposase
MAPSSLQPNRWSALMPQPNDLSRSLVALDQDSTIIAVVEMSQSSWLVAGVLPAGTTRCARKVRFAADSALEEGGFEPSVPL